jgi:hypothetical protein
MQLSINKILAVFGKKTSIERTVVDNYTEDIINSIEDEPFAVSSENVMYTATKELGGFHYLKTMIVGSFKIKTLKGAILEIDGKDCQFKLNTDTEEFESDYSNISNCYITRIDFEIEENHVPLLKKNRINNLVLKAKKHKIEFQIDFN